MTIRYVALIAVVALTLLVGGVAAFQDNLTKFFLKPTTPFQVAAHPAPPDYDDPGAWLSWPVDEPPHGAEVFYVHSTTYYAADFWNAPLDDERSAGEAMEVALPNEAGPFARGGRVFAPAYRQATRAVGFTHKYHGMAARALAFEDVAAAFDRFLAVRNPDAPIILVGYGQGAMHVAGLLRRNFGADDAGVPAPGALADDPGARPAALRKRLVAAYLIGEPTPSAALASLPTPLPTCNDKRAFRCVVAYNHIERRFRAEIEENRSRAVFWDARLRPVSLPTPEPVCVNPVTWRDDDAPASREDHLGAASATGIAFGDTPPAVAKSVDAQCVDGVLIVDPPSQSYLQRPNWLAAKWRAQSFNLFFHDLAENAALRTAALSVKLREEAQILEPIGNSVDIAPSPINKVPGGGD